MLSKGNYFLQNFPKGDVLLKSKFLGSRKLLMTWIRISTASEVYTMVKPLEKSSFAFFYLVFPGYFVYHFLMALGLAPPGLGWFTATLLVASLFYFLVYLFRITSLRLSIDELWILIPFFSLLSIMVGTQIYYYLWGLEFVETSGLVWSFSNVIFFFSLFFIGYNLPNRIGRSSRFVCFVFVLFALFGVLYWYDFSSMLFKPSISEGINVSSGDLANYQGIARSIFSFCCKWQ